MSTEIPREFREAMKRLVGLKFAPVTMDTHWQGLKDLTLEDLDRAIAVAVRECDSFPSPAEIRQFVIDSRPPVGGDEDRSVPLVEPVAFESPHFSKPLTVTREWTYYCERCSDTGWASFWCGDMSQRKPWQGVGRCDRSEDHGSHEYVQHCACWGSNPAVLKKRERNAQQAAHRTAKDQR